MAMEHHLLTDQEWGRGPGAWSVLRHLYPDADVPVFEVSLDHACGFREHVALGKRMRHLRERGVLILGSGNLSSYGPCPTAGVVHYLPKRTRPSPHNAPILYCLGSRAERDRVSYHTKGWSSARSRCARHSSSRRIVETRWNRPRWRRISVSSPNLASGGVNEASKAALFLSARDDFVPCCSSRGASDLREEAGLARTLRHRLGREWSEQSNSA